MIKLYPDRRVPAMVRVLFDAITIVWTVGWAVLGWLIYQTVMGLEVIADGIANTGATFNSWIESFRAAVPTGVPLLTDFLHSNFARRAVFGVSAVGAVDATGNPLLQSGRIVPAGIFAPLEWITFQVADAAKQRSAAPSPA